MKCQVLYDDTAGRILSLAFSEGKKHDFRLYKESTRLPDPDVHMLADSGYQGIDKIHQNSETPIKKPKGGHLGPDDKEFNKTLSSIRITVEHVNAWLKRFAIVGGKYRNKRSDYWKPMLLIAGFYNYRFCAH